MIKVKKIYIQYSHMFIVNIFCHDRAFYSAVSSTTFNAGVIIAICQIVRVSTHVEMITL